MRIEVERKSANHGKGGEQDLSFHGNSAAAGLIKKATASRIHRVPPFVIANMWSMPDKCAARL